MTPGVRKLTIFLSLLLFAFTSKTQDTILISRSVWDSLYSAQPYTAYYIDTTNSMDIDAARAQHFKLTREPRKVFKRHGSRRVTSWFRWRLLNGTQNDIDVVFMFHRLTIFSLYLEDDNGIKMLKNDPPFFTQRSKNERRSAMIPIPRQSVATVYARMYDPIGNLFLNYPILGSREKWKEEMAIAMYINRNTVFVNVIFLSIIFFLVVHTMAQYVFNRRKEFLSYALYGAVVLMYLLFKFDEINYIDISFGHFPYIHIHGNIPLSYLMYFAYYRFIRGFINFKEISLTFYKLIIATEKILLVAILVDLSFIALNVYLARAIVFDVLRCYLLITGFSGIFLLFRSGNRQAYFIAVGSCCLLLGALASMVVTWLTEGTIRQFDALVFMKTGMVMELLCFTLALSYNVSLIEKEKIRAQQQLILQLKENKKLQEEMTTRLEVRVHEQMSEIISQQQLLEKEKEHQLTLKFNQKLTEMELQVLKAQLNPHFYFNTLNNLYGLTIVDPKKAPDAILKLSDIMEYVIYDCKSEKVPLDKELKFISSYIELEKLRYEDSTHIVLHVQGSSKGKFISPLLLIQFVENAFKHGMEQNKADSYLEVHISIADNHLMYRSVNSAKGKSSKANGVGLSNVQKRLNMLYPGRHRLDIDDGGSKFKVELFLDLSPGA